MTLAAGTRLGPYEILSPVGAGGMGEVYLARDTRLGREVAIKVLPSHHSANPDLKARFEREAKAISQLSHPNICALYDVGSQDGVEYLVMEYLEGETLAERLEKGAIPLTQWLGFAIQMADALASAHRRQIVHRDLKPGNVMLTESGLKLVDFGLAKISRGLPEGRAQASSSSPTKPAAENSLTETGTVMGTFPYMAPEQVEGKVADARTDVFALGCVMYEMATGKRAFTGSSRASLIAAIMTKDPEPISALAPGLPPALERLIMACLAKDPGERWESSRDLRTELSWILEARSPDQPLAPSGRRRKTREPLAWAAAALGALLAAALAVLPRVPPGPRREVRLQVLPPPGTSFALQEAPQISPDGTRLAFVAIDSAGRSRLYIRPLDSQDARVLEETDGASMHFWSPDSRALGFFASGKLKTIAVNEGKPRILCDAPVGRGGSWGRDGMILYVPSPPEPPFLIPASGGPARALPGLGKMAGRFFPEFLSDGKHYAFLSVSSGRRSRALCVGSLGSKEETRLFESAWSGAVAPPNYLLYRRETTLLAQRFDGKRFQPAGEPFVVASDVGFNPITWQALFSVSENGIVAFHSSAGAKTQLTWLDRNGKVIETLDAPRISNTVSLSPDERSVAFDEADPSTGDVGVWLTETGRDAPFRFTFGSPVSFFPVWSPDGRRVVYSRLEGPPQLYQKVASGAGDEEPLLRNDRAKIPTGFSPDGRYLVFAALDPRTQFDLWVLPLFGDRKPFPYLQSQAAEIGGQISPNGRWMAYTSNESGAYEVYIRPFPLAPGKWQVSRDGGSQPRWRGDGKELFYLSTDRRMMAVGVATDRPGFDAGTPTPLFETRVANVEGSNPWSQYAVSGDGRRFLVERVAAEAASSPITVVLDWAGVGKPTEPK